MCVVKSPTWTPSGNRGLAAGPVQVPPMAFEVGKRVVAESESADRRPRPGVIEEGDHLHARKRRPSSRTTQQGVAKSATTETLNVRRLNCSRGRSAGRLAAPPISAGRVRSRTGLVLH